MVEYEFTVQGRKWRGNRISVGEDAGGANLEATLQRYPVGATATVYYDPKNPSNCVLECELPKGFGKGCAVLLAIAAVIIGVIWYFVVNGSRLVDTYLPNVPPFSIALFCFGLAVLLFFFVSRRMSKQAQSWPVVSGTIVSSSVESYEKYEDGRRTT
jgi:uncharacterized protein DUF3592